MQEPRAKPRQSDVLASSLSHCIIMFPLIKVGLGLNVPLFVLEIVVSNLIDKHLRLPSRNVTVSYEASLVVVSDPLKCYIVLHILGKPLFTGRACIF